MCRGLEIFLESIWKEFQRYSVKESAAMNVPRGDARERSLALAGAPAWPAPCTGALWTSRQVYRAARRVCLPIISQALSLA